MERGGQITIFFIIGLVLIIAIGLYLFTASNVRYQESFKKISEQIEKPELKDHIYFCMDSILAEVLKETGMQGGLLFPQADIHKGRNPFEVIQNTKVAYGIRVNNRQEDYDVLSPYNNPIPQKDSLEELNNASCDKKYWCGYFGEYTLPKLCSKSGPNNLESKNYLCLSEAYNWPVFLVAVIQEMINQHLSLKISECIDKDKISTITGGKVILGTPTTELILLPKNIKFKLTYPVTLRGESAVKNMVFEKKYPFRLTELYYFIQDILSKNIKDPTFSIKDDYKTSKYFLSDFSVSIQENFFGTSDLYVFSDGKSKIEDSPLQIRFLIENRPPYLLNTKVAVPCFQDPSDKEWLWEKIKDRVFDPDGNLPKDSSAIFSVDTETNTITLKDTDGTQFIGKVEFDFKEC